MAGDFTKDALTVETVGRYTLALRSDGRRWCVDALDPDTGEAFRYREMRGEIKAAKALFIWLAVALQDGMVPAAPTGEWFTLEAA